MVIISVAEPELVEPKLFETEFNFEDARMKKN